ncbi:MAG: oligoendopeptidase F, partial [Candidatus Marinimicrobia bacterium]|nr:oligoendopeptidase F [Candidatus Neomarinimicrobiota bacterium]
PDALYDALITGVRASLPSYHRYLDLRADRLGLNRLHAYDAYVPLVAAAPREIPFAEARAWLCAACEPLGGAYLEWLERAFRERWIDVYENRGKVSGAYSSACYGSKPYVLLNYQGRLHDVFTLAHELGHAVHTALANEAQPAHLAHYPIFLAEIASTCTEELLLLYLLRRFAAEPGMSALLLNQACDAYRGTVVRQTLFADFEHQIHELDAQGVALTPASLSRLYGGLNRHYQGPRFVADAHSDAEWLRIPHFHYNFYVYKYATSFCAAQIFAARLENDPAWRDAYLGLLRAGGAAEPLDLLRAAGVDLEQPLAFNEAAARFVERLEALRRCFSDQ